MQTSATRLSPTRPPAKKRSSPGFTLIEIAVAVAILALGTTLVVVYLDAMLPQSRLQAAARKLASEVASLRSNAITQSHSFFLEYDLDRERYRTVTPFRVGGGIAVRPEDRIAFDWVDLPEGVGLQSVALASGEPAERGTAVVEFDPLGSSVEHWIHLRQEFPETEFTLYVDGLTGLVRFRTGRPSEEKLTDADFP